MSRVLVYCLEGLNMPVWCKWNGLWICIWFLWWTGFGSSLPFACLFAMYVVLLLLRWSSIYWWEQMREAFVVSRGEMTLLHSLWAGLHFFLGFVRVKAHVLLDSLILYFLLLDIYLVFFGIVMCLELQKLCLRSQNCAIVLFVCDISFNFA